MIVHETPHYWVGYLATTVAHAVVLPEPQPLLRQALRDFLGSLPADSTLGKMLRETLDSTKGTA